VGSVLTFALQFVCLPRSSHSEASSNHGLQGEHRLYGKGSSVAHSVRQRLTFWLPGG